MVVSHTQKALARSLHNKASTYDLTFVPPWGFHRAGSYLPSYRIFGLASLSARIVRAFLVRSSKARFRPSTPGMRHHRFHLLVTTRWGEDGRDHGRDHDPAGKKGTRGG